jgi:hypothetical protein
MTKVWKIWYDSSFTYAQKTWYEMNKQQLSYEIKNLKSFLIPPPPQDRQQNSGRQNSYMDSVRHYGPTNIWHNGTKFCGTVNPSFGQPWQKNSHGTDVHVLWCSELTSCQLAVGHWRFGHSMLLQTVGYPNPVRSGIRTFKAHPCADLCWWPHCRDKTAEDKAHIAAASLQIPYLLCISDKHSLNFPDDVQILLSDTDSKEAEIHCDASFVKGYDRQ